jgi:drug/metabolite transporter (DMT)-like permease
MRKGILFALLASFISGVSIFYNKVVIINGIDPTVFNIIKNGTAALIVSGIILFNGQQKSFSSLSKKRWMQLIIIGLIGGSIPFVLFFEGLKTTPAINATLIQKSLFIWVAFLAIPLLKEKLTKMQIFGYILIVLSNFFIGGFKEFTASNGEFLILLATFFWAIELIVSKNILNHVDSKIVIWGRIFFGSIFLIVYAILTQKVGLIAQISQIQLLPIIGSIILLTGYVLSFYKALSFAPATTVTAILILATTITNILSVIFITHGIDITQLINIIFSILGISFVLLFLSKSAKSTGLSPV